MSIPKSFVLAAAVALGMSMPGHTASRYRAAPVYDTYGWWAQHQH
jgi:hypothetical protein